MFPYDFQGNLVALPDSSGNRPDLTDQETQKAIADAKEAKKAKEAEKGGSVPAGGKPGNPVAEEDGVSKITVRKHTLSLPKGGVTCNVELDFGQQGKFEDASYTV